MAASAHPAAPSEARVVGRSLLSLEDPPLLTGKGSFVGDLSFPRQLRMRVVRSAHAHGRIVAIDSAAALAAPGVVGVWTSRDIVDLPPIGLRGGMGTQQTDVIRLTPYRQPGLAQPATSG
jgi:carbon-monoxide dehydrogenase large subunit